MKTNGPNLKKNDKKPNFGPDFGPFGPNLDHHFFFQDLPLLVMKHCSKLSSNAITKEN